MKYRRRRRRRRGGRPGLRLAAGRAGQARDRGRAAPLPGRPGHGDRVPRPQDRPGLAPGGGPRRQPDARLRAAGAGAGAQRAQRLDALLGPRRLAADPGLLRGRQPGRAEALHRGRRRGGLRRLRGLGPRVAARVDGAAHLRRGRLPGVGGDLDARADHRPPLGALGLREPLHPQAPLHLPAHGRLLVLADGRLGPPLGRAGRRVPRPRRRDPAAGGRRAGAGRARPRGRRGAAPAAGRRRDARGDRGRRRGRERPRLGPAGALRRRRRCRGTCRSGSACWRRTATARAGSATGSPRRSR